MTQTLGDIPSQLSLRLQLAPKGTHSSCAQATGWTNVSSSSQIAFGSAPPANGTAIGSLGAANPFIPSVSPMGFSYQHIVRSGTSFTDSSDFLAQTTALWDFPLKDLTQTPNDTYCLRLTSLDSSVTIDSYDVYAEVSSFEGEITVRSVDSSGDEVTGMGTNTLFSEAVISAATQTSTAFLTDSLTKQLEIHNSQSANGWNVTLAAANGEFSAWTHGTDSYPYNSSALNGRMGVDLSTSTVQGVGEDLVGQPCSSTTGIAKPNSTSYFANGTTSSITLLSGSSSSQLGCNWRLSSILLS